jgi:hypothetical protein
LQIAYLDPDAYLLLWLGEWTRVEVELVIMRWVTGWVARMDLVRLYLTERRLKQKCSLIVIRE